MSEARKIDVHSGQIVLERTWKASRTENPESATSLSGRYRNKRSKVRSEVKKREKAINSTATKVLYASALQYHIIYLIRFYI